MSEDKEKIVQTGAVLYKKNNMMTLFFTVALCCNLLVFYHASGSPIVTGKFDDASEEEDVSFSPVPATAAISTVQDTLGEFNTVLANNLKRDRTEYESNPNI